ncbi:MAG: DUF4143 domain-containing protein [Patulibacter sp.]
MPNPAGFIADLAVPAAIDEVQRVPELMLESLSRDLGIPERTLRSYLGLLTTLFLVTRLPAWSSNLLSRETKAPKVSISDSGLLLALLGADAERIVSDPQLAGLVIETFVANEVTRLAEALVIRPRLYHLRDRDGREVDLIIERRDGMVAAVEVKSSATVGPKDFRGLRYLRQRLGDRFLVGCVLYTGRATVPAGGGLWAVPVSALWGGGAPYMSRERQEP